MRGNGDHWKDPIRARCRVVHAEHGPGTVQGTIGWDVVKSEGGPGATCRVQFDNGEPVTVSGYIRPIDVPLDELELIPLDFKILPVRKRRVLMTGHKEQVFSYAATLDPLSREKIAQGYRRYIEFLPDVMARERHRVRFQVGSQARVYPVSGNMATKYS